MDPGEFMPAQFKKLLPNGYSKITPPGPQLFLAPFGDGSLLYGFDDDLNPVIINSSTEKSEMAANVQKIKGLAEKLVEYSL